MILGTTKKPLQMLSPQGFSILTGILQLTAQYALLPEHDITLPGCLPFVFSN